jgi:hypothetical protein
MKIVSMAFALTAAVSLAQTSPNETLRAGTVQMPQGASFFRGAGKRV